jgi:2-succinyl-5-enolpyruvyl-6-hydroxy-3-cyclohexene-1-carboxylate synthase
LSLFFFPPRVIVFANHFMNETNSSLFDALACSNVNFAWGALTMEVLSRLGVETVVTSPGSRSTPLTVAAVRNPKIEALSILDERSAGFFALGLAKHTRRPVALVCTSGSAAVNYHPAILEASMSGTALIVLTADRPPELRDCSSGQTIDQLKLFGDSVRMFHEMALPEATPAMLAYLRQTLVHAVVRSLNCNPGPVHLNFPFRDPLHPDAGSVPVIEANAMELAATVSTRPCESPTAGASFDAVAVERLASHQRGLIVVGCVNPADGDESFADAVAMLSSKLGWPVLSDALNPLRGHAGENQALICHYDAFLRNPERVTELLPTAILQIGPLPTSKVLRAWLSDLDAVSFLLSDRPVNTDPLHRIATPLLGEAHILAEVLPHQQSDLKWLQGWIDMETNAARVVDREMEAIVELFEGKVAWTLSHHLPMGTSIYFASSMSVRYAEYFWRAGSRSYSVYCNRGANGIDGTLGTALGVGHRGKPTVLLTGDLAFLHDTNALLAVSEMNGSLTVVLVNNHGGGIFEHLPIAVMEPAFEKYFATPQNVNIGTLCQAYGVAYQRIQDWEAFVATISLLPESGIRVIELLTDRKADLATLRALLSRVSYA